MTSLERIESELEQLKPALTCKTDSGGLAENWQKWFPGISPKKLIASLGALKSRTGQPQLVVSFKNNVMVEHAGITLATGTAHDGFSMELNLYDGSVKLEGIHAKRSGNPLQAKLLLKWVANLSESTGRPLIKLTATDINGAYTWARFGFEPTVDEWENLKTHVRQRLNPSRDRIIFNDPAMAQHRSQYEYLYPDGIMLSSEEQNVIAGVLQSNDPKQIWKLSDLGRDVTPTAGIPDSNSVTIGKALLCGLTWQGQLALDSDNRGLERFAAYIGYSPDRSLHTKR